MPFTFDLYRYSEVNRWQANVGDSKDKANIQLDGDKGGSGFSFVSAATEAALKAKAEAEVSRNMSWVNKAGGLYKLLSSVDQARGQAVA